MNAKERIAVAQRTLQITDAGHYTNRQGQQIDIADAIRAAEAGTILYKPEDFDKLYEQRSAIDGQVYDTIFEVVNETTMQAMERLQPSTGKMVCLNFASAKNPGGGFLGGAVAQEECLARSSALYYCISQRSMMYSVNRKHGSCLYTDHMIYSPAVPFFCNDEGDLLDTPYTCSVLTVPAVNAGVVMQQEPQSIEKIDEVMLSRMEKLLSIALVKEYETLILGAWGCGVFRNPADKVAEYFRYHLKENPTFKGKFKKVIFAVLDTWDNKRTIGPFIDRFG